MKYSSTLQLTAIIISLEKQYNLRGGDKIKNRKERLEFIARKKGQAFISDMVYMTDRQVKAFANQFYALYSKLPDYVEHQYQFPVCKKCGVEVIINYECYCGINECEI